MYRSRSKQTYIHVNSYALGLGLKRRLRATRKWAIVFNILSFRTRQSLKASRHAHKVVSR